MESSLSPESHREAIHRYLRNLVNNQTEADDLTQEVLLRAHRSVSSHRGQASLKTWMYRIASNVFIDHLRSMPARMEKVTDTLEDSPAWSWEDEPRQLPDEASIQEEQSACIQDYVDALPPSYRAVLVMHDMEGLTNAEIASVLGCTLATAKIRLHRARQKLKESMNRGCVISSGRDGAPTCEPKPKPHSDPAS